MKTASARSGQVSFVNDSGIVTLVNAKRGECQIDYRSALCKIFQNKYAAFAVTYVNNYIHHFSPDFMMVNGNSTQYSVLPQHGLLYITEYLAFIAGIYFLFASKQIPAYLLIAWIFLSPLADSMTGDGHYSRFLVILPSVQMAAAYGIYRIWSKLAHKRFVMLLLLPLFLYETVSFSTFYWSYFPRFYATFSHYGYKDLVRFIADHESKYDAVVVSNRVNDTKQYIYYLFYTKYDPKTYQESKNIDRVAESGGWIRIRRIGKIYFLPSITMPLEHVSDTMMFLYAGAPSEFKTTGFYTVSDPKNNPVFIFTEENGKTYNTGLLKSS
jgi:hypothetical protein